MESRKTGAVEKASESVKFDSIESLNRFLSQEYGYGYEGFDVAELLKDYGRLREFYAEVGNLVGKFSMK